MNFGSRLPHATPEIKRNFVVPDTYDTGRLERAFNMTSNLKNPKALLSMDKSPIRDNSMYKLDHTYMSEIKRKTRKKSFGLSDYLPTNVGRTVDLRSNASCFSRNIGSISRPNASTYFDSSIMPQIRQELRDFGSKISVHEPRTTNRSLSHL